MSEDLSDIVKTTQHFASRRPDLIETECVIKVVEPKASDGIGFHSNLHGMYF